MTLQAKEVLEKCEVIVGYTGYTSLVKPFFPDKEYWETGMMGERERCEKAVEIALEEKDVAVICSGDSGVYGMASLVLETMEQKGVEGSLPVEVVPGITAALSGGSLLGAPLAHDFVVISLSDLMTPWSLIAKRLEKAAQGDFCIALYNPSSKKRKDYLQKACDILLKYRSTETVCGVVTCIGRDGEEKKLYTLQELRDAQVDMQTTVFIGNSRTRRIGDYMVTPRGYTEKYGAKKDVLVFAGTSEGRQLCQFLQEEKLSATVFVATEYGEQILNEKDVDPHYISIHTGRLVEQEMQELFVKEQPQMIIDATHPFATVVTENIKKAAKEANIPYYRLLREETKSEENEKDTKLVKHVSSAGMAAKYLLDSIEETGKIFLTTGSKEIPVFANTLKDLSKVYVRILPSEENIALCKEYGIKTDHIICMQGPFSEEMNYLQMKEYGITHMVTKESGKAGGFEEKLRAAKRLDVTSIVIERPKESGLSMDEMKDIIKSKL